MSLLNTLGIPFNFISFGALQAANCKHIEEEDVLGINVQNILGQIPIYNFFVGIGRIEKSVEHLQSFESSGEFLSDTDKAEIRHARLHVARGVVELIPGASLIFLIPDIIFSIVKSISEYFKCKKGDIPSEVNEVNKIKSSLYRNYNRWVGENNPDESLKYKNEVKNLINKYIEKIKECEEIVANIEDGELKKKHEETLNELKTKATLNYKTIPTDTALVDRFLDTVRSR